MAETLVREQYGFTGRASRLAGERDDNFLLEDDQGQKVFLKIAHIQEPWEVTNLATSVLLHLAEVAPNIPAQRVLPTLDGRTELAVPSDSGPIRTARLTSFLEGTILRAASSSPALRRELGRSLALLNRALKSFDHPGLHHRHLLWDITQADRISQLIDRDSPDQAVLSDCLERFRAEVEPRLAGVRAQPVHNDFSRDNLVVDETCTRLTGILDFGDLMSGPLVNDVAIAAYQLWDPENPIESAADFISGYCEIDPLLPEEVDLIYDLILMRITWRIAISEWRAKRFAGNRDYILRNTSRAWVELDWLLGTSREELNARMAQASRKRQEREIKQVDMANAFDGSGLDAVKPATRELIRRRARLLGPAYRLFYEAPVEFVRGSGVWLYDAEGNAYLDAYNNVPSVGHSHPDVVAAIAGQAAALNTHTRYPAAPILDYAERLLDTHSPALEQVMFACTGSEAVDLALRITRFNTEAEGIVISANAYHGLTSAVAGISPSLGDNSALDPAVRAIEVPDAAGRDPAGVIAEFVADLGRAIDDLERSGAGFAGFIADSIFSSDGVRAEPVGMLAAAADLVHARGGIYIADEVQAGFGRTGERMWGYQRHGFEPDLAVMGKPMGNGMPISAVAARPSLLETFGEKIRYFNTFGGNSVCVAAASAVLDVLEREGLMENSRSTGARLKGSLVDLGGRYGFLGPVRGTGLFLAVDVVDPDDGLTPDPALASRIVNGMMARRVLTGLTGPYGATLKIRPPLPFGGNEADEFCARLDATCAALEAGLPG